MSNILVSGLINIETTLKVDSFPLTYEPVRYPFWGVNSTVSGVGYNVARALTTLGDQVSFFSLSGKDLLGGVVQTALAQDAIPARNVLPLLDQTAQSVIVYEPSGRRQIHVDLKNIQEFEYPLHRFTEALPVCDLAVLCNINFSRPFLAAAQAAAKPIATDVHTISNLEDDYNRDFMAAACILFMSNEKLPCSPEEWARRLQNRYGTPIVVIGLGGEGALLAVKDGHFMERVPAVTTRPIVNTIGAGDALFSSFVHVFSRTNDPYLALRQAVVFASYKIGETGAAQGFLTAVALQNLYESTKR
ncbi:MAG: carbohydrate kinase family protein [Chloroflexota bacterium]